MVYLCICAFVHRQPPTTPIYDRLHCFECNSEPNQWQFSVILITLRLGCLPRLSFAVNGTNENCRMACRAAGRQTEPLKMCVDSSSPLPGAAAAYRRCSWPLSQLHIICESQPGWSRHPICACNWRFQLTANPKFAVHTQKPFHCLSHTQHEYYSKSALSAKLCAEIKSIETIRLFSAVSFLCCCCLFHSLLWQNRRMTKKAKASTWWKRRYSHSWRMFIVCVWQFLFFVFFLYYWQIKRAKCSSNWFLIVYCTLRGLLIGYSKSAESETMSMRTG